MPNPFDQFDEPVTAVAPPEEQAAEADQPQANAFDQFDEVPPQNEPAAPKSNAVADVAKRVVRGAAAGLGQVASAGARFSDAYAELLPSWMKAQKAPDEVHPLDQAATAASAVAKRIPVDAARDTELKSALAEGAGSAVPALAAGVVNPVLGVTALAGQMGEAERDASIAAGDSPELAAEKAKLARLGGAVMGVLPVGPVRKVASVGERLVTRAATGAAINAAQEAGMEKLIDDKIDWGRVKTAGAFGAGLGLVIGVPEAIALKKAFPGAGSHEGKTLSQAVEAIAAETGAEPTAIQQRINDAVGVKPEATGEARAVRVAELDDTLGVQVKREGVEQSLFASRLKRQGDLETAFADLEPPLEEQLGQRQVGPVQSSESLAWLHEGDAGRQAEAGLTTLDSRLGAGEGAAAERARLAEQLPADSPLRPAASDVAAETGPRLSPQAQRMMDQYGQIDPKLLLPLARAAIGGVLGFTQGGTPEERMAKALLGMGISAAASPALARRLIEMVGHEARARAGSRSAEFQYTIQKAQVHPVDGRTIPGYTQIDEIKHGANTRSSNLATLRKEGIELPEPPAWLPTGRYTRAEIETAIKAGPPMARRGNQTQTPEFKAWFGDSQATSDEGTPQVFYHGAKAGGFSTFDKPSYFAPEPKVAEGYMREKRGSAMYPVYLSAKNPLRVSSVQELLRKVPSAAAHIDAQNPLFENLEQGPVRQKIQAAGYDSVVFHDVSPGGLLDHEAWLVFKPTQIKSAAANRGAFSPTSADISGRISPELLVPLARSAVAGTIGYATGDTPEERVQNALIGAGIGLAASPALAKRLAAQVLRTPAGAKAEELFRAKSTALRLKVAPQSLLPKEIRTQLRWGEQAVNAITNQGLSLTRDLERAIGGVGNAPVKAAAAGQVKDFLDGKVAAAALPAPVRVAAQKVRDYVDALTDRAVAEGVVSGLMAQTFLANRGSYLRRSYEIFLNPDYKPAKPVVDAAITAVAQAQGVGRAEAESVVAGILDKNGRNGLPDFLLGRGKVAGKDVGSLVRRQDLLPEVRALLGEIKDPILAANQTIPRMARLIEHDATQRVVRSLGERLGLFSDVRSLEQPTPIVAEGSATHDVLAGLYAAPEIAAAMQKEASSGRTAFVPEVLWKTLTTASSAAKMAKTVLNPESYAPNFIGGIIANLGNANFRYNHAARGLALGAEELGALRRFVPANVSRDGLRAELAELQKLGVIGESVNSQDLLRTLESSFFGVLKDRTKNVLALPSKVYGSVDDFNRYVAWQSERVRYSRAFPQMAADELKRHAAEVVRATTPVYSEVPKLVKQLSVAGIAPSFVNFTWEVFRNTKNSVAIGLRDLQQGRATGNSGLVRAGAERLAAITAVVGAGSMWGFSKLSRDSNGITDEKDAAVRYFSPKWNRDGVLQYLSPVKPGQPIQYSNLSYLVPHALLFQAIEAGRRGSDEGQAIPEFLRALNEQFGFGNSVLIPPVAGAIQGFDPRTGRSIPKTAVDPTFLDRAKYLGDQAFKPLVADWIEKFNKARFGEKGAFGRVYTVDEQMKRLVGIRAQTLDPMQAVQWKARDIGAKFQDATSLYRLQLKQSPTPERAGLFYNYAQEARRAQFEDLGAMIKHARVLGVKEDAIIGAMREAHVPPAVILGALDGKYPELERDARKTGAEYLAELQARPQRERGAALAQLYRDDPSMGKTVLGLIRTAAKGRTEYDKAILGLGVGDGARADYLREKLTTLPGAAERRAFLTDLARKGILTEEVLRQMATAQR